jgi:hypothetical protein
VVGESHRLESCVQLGAYPGTGFGIGTTARTGLTDLKRGRRIAFANGFLDIGHGSSYISMAIYV